LTAYRFVLFSSDRTEPPHIHVKRERTVAKFWLSPISLVKNKGFPEHELAGIERLVVQHQEELIQGWHDHFNT
jgi:hypothetical protein